jgi:restriction endonuclease Mrr
LLISPKRGFFRITEDGLKLLRSNPPRIDSSTLEQFPAFIEFKNRRNHKSEELNYLIKHLPRDISNHHSETKALLIHAKDRIKDYHS